MSKDFVYICFLSREKLQFAEYALGCWLKVLSVEYCSEVTLWALVILMGNINGEISYHHSSHTTNSEPRLRIKFNTTNLWFQHRQIPIDSSISDTCPIKYALPIKKWWCSMIKSKPVPYPPPDKLCLWFTPNHHTTNTTSHPSTPWSKSQRTIWYCRD